MEKEKKEEEEKIKIVTSNSKRLLKQEIDSEEIADVAGKWTGIPVSKLLISAQYNKYS